MAKGGGNKKRFQYCTDPSRQEILYFRALQGHSGRNLIDPSLQDNVSIPNNLFEYIYYIGSAINLHSIMNSGLIPGGQNLCKRQTAFFMPLDGQEDGVTKAVPRQAAADSRGFQTCVCATQHLYDSGWHTQERRMN